MTAPDPLREDEVEAVVRRMTKAQSALIASFGEDEARDYRSIQGRVRMELFRKGILRLSAWSGSPQRPQAGLSPLGLDARAAILRLDQVREGRK